MKTAIVDTEFNGHHLEYIYGVSSFLRNYEKKNTHFDLFCDVKLFDYINKNDLNSISDIKGLNIYTNSLNKIDGSWYFQKKKAYQNIHRLKDYDKVIFMNINPYLLPLTSYAFLKDTQFSFSGIFFNPFFRNEKSYKDIIRNVILYCICRMYKDSRIFILNDMKTPQSLNKRFSTSMFKMIRDPVPFFFYNKRSKSVARSGDKLTYLMTGTLSERKGVFQFLRAIEASKSKNRFVLIGRVKENIVERIESKVKKLTNTGLDVQLKNDFITNKKFAQNIDRADVIVAPYLSSGASSGIIGHAAFRQKPLIGPSQGLLSEIIKKYELGVTINPYNIKMLANYLNNGLQIKRACNFRKMKQYAELNTYKIFNDKLLEMN